MSFAVHSFTEAAAVFLGSLTIGIGWSFGCWIVGKISK